MLKVLLVNPPFNNQRSNYDCSISVALLSLASYLDNHGVSVKIIDGARQENYLDLIKHELKDTDIVGFSVMTTQLTNALKLSQLSKQINKNIIVIWGGFHATFFSKEIAEHKSIDLAVIGEGEQT